MVNENNENLENATENNGALEKTNFKIKKFELKIGLLKVIFGTGIVGLAGVLVPSAVEFWNAYFENSRKNLEIEVSKQQAHNEYVKAFLDTALNQDIELRIRFAEYFASVSDSDYIAKWKGYRLLLSQKRKKIREEINKKEVQLRSLMAKPKEERSVNDQIKIAELERTLEWDYKEVGYVEKNRSVVQSPSEKASTAKDKRDFGEDTSAEIPDSDFIEKILGTPPIEAEQLITIELPYEMHLAWSKETRIKKIQVHRAFAENFQKAFQTIYEQGLEQEAMGFGGTYNVRKRRGSSTEWSPHSWGISIALNPSQNRLDWGRDKFQMHPGVVRAFKAAGFAWYGDRNFSAMSFCISKHILEQYETNKSIITEETQTNIE